MLAVFFILMILVGVFLGVYFDYKDWNNGVSPYDGTNWKMFDKDSQGGRGYKDESGNYIWVSYRVDSNYKGVYTTSGF